MGRLHLTPVVLVGMFGLTPPASAQAPVWDASRPGLP